jgi:hypothetical protein
MGVYRRYDFILYAIMGPLKVHVAGQNTSQFLGGSILSAVSLELWLYFKDLIFFRCYSWNDCNSLDFYNYSWWTGSAASRTLKQLLLETKGYG